MRSLLLRSSVLLPFAAAGCGGSAPAMEPAGSRAVAPAAVELVDTAPRSGLYAVDGPRRVAAGATRVTVRNRTARERGAQLVRVDRGHGARRAIAAVRAAADGRPLPRWLHWAGGIGVIRPRTTATFTVALRPGRHYAIDRSHEGRQPARAARATRLDVIREGDEARLPAPAARITARDYTLRARGLGAGRRLVALRNAGAQPHDVVIAPIQPGRTLDDVRAFAIGEDESGPPPVDFAREVISGVLAPGTAQTVQLDLRPGRYALLCFAADREGGPPHVVQGMIAQTRVR